MGLTGWFSRLALLVSATHSPRVVAQARPHPSRLFFQQPPAIASRFARAIACPAASTAGDAEAQLLGNCLKTEPGKTRRDIKSGRRLRQFSGHHHPLPAALGPVRPPLPSGLPRWAGRGDSAQQSSASAACARSCVSPYPGSFYGRQKALAERHPAVPSLRVDDCLFSEGSRARRPTPARWGTIGCRPA